MCGGEWPERPPNSIVPLSPWAFIGRGSLDPSLRLCRHMPAAPYAPVLMPPITSHPHCPGCEMNNLGSKRYATATPSEMKRHERLEASRHFTPL